MDLKDFLAWAAPIASTLIVCAGQLALNARFKVADQKRDLARLETEAKRRAEREWRDEMERKLDAQGENLDAIKDATQTTMRTSLLHYAEKYLTRGWVTPEERASLYDMYKKYSALNANGYIDSYIKRVMALPDREI